MAPKKIGPKIPKEIMDHHKRLERFLQAIALYAALVGYSSKKTLAPVHSDTFTQNLRKFLHCLCLTCDSRRGGDTVTAMAVEETASGYILWVSQNKPEPETVLSHLRSVLAVLQQPGQTPTEKYEKLGLITASYSAKRIKSTRDLARKSLSTVVGVLRGTGREVGSLDLLLSHLDTAEPSGFFAMCRSLYEMRKDQPMAFLKSESDQHHGSILQREAQNTHHYIGRLAEQYRTVKVLVDLQNDVIQFFKDSDIQFVSTLEPQSWDSLTLRFAKPLTIENVLRKHFSVEDRLKRAVNVIQRQQDKHQTFDKFIEEYGKFKKCNNSFVHCEMALAIDLHRRNAQFLFKDRYISTSKPYCLMCRYFLEYHPGRFVEGSSSGNLWPSWSLPLVGPDDQEQLAEFRPLISEVIRDMRKKIEDWIEDPSTASDRDTDSLTNITESVCVDYKSDQSSDFETEFSSTPEHELVVWKDDVLSLSSETIRETQDIFSHSDSDSDDGGVLLFSGRH